MENLFFLNILWVKEGNASVIILGEVSQEELSFNPGTGDSRACTLSLCAIDVPFGLESKPEIFGAGFGAGEAAKWGLIVLSVSCIK